MINVFLTYRNRNVVSDAVRKSVMNMLHSSYDGSAAMKSQTRNIVLWPHNSGSIKDKVRD